MRSFGELAASNFSNLPLPVCSARGTTQGNSTLLVSAAFLPVPVTDGNGVRAGRPACHIGGKAASH